MKPDRRPTIVDVSAPVVVEPPKFKKPFRCIGVARVEGGWVSVAVDVDTQGRATVTKVGNPQSMIGRHFVTAEAKRWMHAAVTE